MYMFTSLSTVLRRKWLTVSWLGVERAQEPGPSDYEYIRPWTLLKLENCPGKVRKVARQVGSW